MPADRKMDGVDLVPFAVGIAAGFGDGPPSVPHEKLFWRSGHSQVVIADGWKLQRADRPEKVWLFNLFDDPTEQNNVAGDYPDRTAAMIKMLEAHNAEQKPTVKWLMRFAVKW